MTISSTRTPHSYNTPFRQVGDADTARPSNTRCTKYHGSPLAQMDYQQPRETGAEVGHDCTKKRVPTATAIKLREHNESCTRCISWIARESLIRRPSNGRAKRVTREGSPYRQHAQPLRSPPASLCCHRFFKTVQLRVSYASFR